MYVFHFLMHLLKVNFLPTFGIPYLILFSRISHVSHFFNGMFIYNYEVGGQKYCALCNTVINLYDYLHPSMSEDWDVLVA